MFWRRIIYLMLDQDGASAAEYALILAIIGGAIAISALALGSSISISINRAAGDIANCGGGC
jgi:pilus assembly protein Flp/PilA